MLMKKLHFEIDIEAAPAKIWEALWDKQNYSIWCNEFCEGTFVILVN